MKSIGLTGFIAIALLTALAACNTVDGVGRDISGASVRVGGYL